MSDIKFACPKCGQRIEADSAWAGLDLDCPGCNRIIKAPVFCVAELLEDSAFAHVPAAGKDEQPPEAPTPASADHALRDTGSIQITIDLESLRSSQALKSHGLNFNVSFSPNLKVEEVKGLLTLVALNFKSPTALKE